MGKRQRKVVLPPELPPELSEEEIDVSDEDLEFVRDNIDYAGFVSRLDTNSITKHVKRVAEVGEEELEALYEKRSKKNKTDDCDAKKTPVVDALPVKTLDGILYYPQRFPDEETANENRPERNADENAVVRLSKAERRAKLKKSKKEAKNDSNCRKEVGPPPPQPQVAALAEVKQYLTAEEAFESKKHRIAELGMTLLADPVANVKTLKEMFQFSADKDHRVVKLALLSLSAVFKDVIPGYRIRLPSEKEAEMKVSKDVKRTRFYESSLLSSYKEYLRKLLEILKDVKFQHVAVRCCCALLESLPHFNFVETLLGAVVSNVGSQDDMIRKLCCSTIKSLFANEGKHGGRVTADAVRLIADLVKANNCQLHPDSVEIFLSLSFDDDLWKSEKSEESDKNKKKFHKKGKTANQQNEWKRNKAEMMSKLREEVASEYKAASLATDATERRILQTETLSSIFETYFRILRHAMHSLNSSASPSRAYPLLAPCLNGLAKFSNLLDVDYLGDLMTYLKTLAGDSSSESRTENLTVSERLQCCVVACRVMRSNLDALNVDLHCFFEQLYNLILEYRPERDDGSALAEALRTMLCEDRQHDMQKAAAFIKRLSTFSLCVRSAEAMAALITAKHLLLKNTKCRNLLENDAGGGSVSGALSKYRPDAADPNQSGALASVLWELSLLAHHYNRSISGTASGISAMGSGGVNTSSAHERVSLLSTERELSSSVYNAEAPTLRKKKGCKPHRKTAFPDPSFDGDALRGKFCDHFKVLHNVKENKRLRLLLDQTTHELKLYDDFAKHKNN